MLRAFIFEKTAGIPAIALTAALTFVPQPLSAQENPRSAAEFSAGWIGFADDGIVSETPIGGTVRWHVSNDRIVCQRRRFHLDGRRIHRRRRHQG